MIDALLVDYLSPPLSRDHIESAQAIRRLKYAGVRVIGVSDGVDTAREALRQIIGDVRLVPEDGALTAEMQSPGLAGALQIALVAGARSERCLPVLRFPGLR